MKKTIQKSKKSFFLVAITLLLCFYGGFAQSQTISGTVMENVNNLGLPGAEVVIKGTSIGASTDFDGKFNLVYDNPSSATLVITYLGFETREVNVSDYSDPSNITIMLQESTFGLDEVVISANIEGQRRALNIQRSADNIKNIISTDLISRFPDLNVADALQRVPGVNIDLDQGEGDGISIRGTPRNYTTVTINGEQLQNTGTGGDRTSGLYQFAADQLSQIEVTKSVTPDMDGDAIGGSVNLSSPKAKRTTLSVKAEAGGGYNNLTEDVNFTGRLNLNQRFAKNDNNPNGAFGLLGSASFYRTNSGEDRIEGRWRDDDFGNGDQFYLSDLTLRPLTTTRTRVGWTLTSDYQFDRDNFIVLKTFYSHLDEDELRERTVFEFRRGISDDNPELSTGSRIRKRHRDRVVDRYTISLNADAQFKIGNFKILPAFAYSTGQRDEDGIRGEFRANGDGVDLQLQGSDTDFPQIFPVGGQPGDQLDIALFDDLRNFRLYNTNVKSTATTTRIDLEQPIAINNSILTLKGGYKNRVNTRDQDADFNFQSYTGPDVDLSQFNNPNLVRDGLLDGNYNFGAAIDPSALRNYFSANPGFFEVDDNALNNSRREEDNFFQQAEETTNAGYFMAKLRAGKFNILAGARYETVDVSYNANILLEEDPDTGEFSSSPISGGNSYDFLLPNIQLKYELNDLTNIRAAYTQGYARPNFSDIIPAVNINDDLDEVDVGNPDFKPPSADNFDILFERYLGTVGILSGGVFYKRVQDFRIVRELNLVAGVDDFDFIGGDQVLALLNPGDEVDVTLPDNGDDAEVIGVEINIQSNFKFLPGFFRKFGIYLNYTYADSDATIDGVSGRQLPGQSPHTGNASLTFDSGGFSARFSANYQDERVNSIGADEFEPGDRDVIRAERLQLDANASYTFKDRWRIYAEINNITDAPEKLYLGNESRIRDLSYYGFRSTFGVSYTF